jgi:hypothetical protein
VESPVGLSELKVSLSRVVESPKTNWLTKNSCDCQLIFSWQVVKKPLGSPVTIAFCPRFMEFAPMPWGGGRWASSLWVAGLA